MPKYNRLFVPEKSSVGKSLAEYLSKITRNPVVNKGGYLLVGDDVIAPMSGHLLEQVEAHAYDPRYEKWRIEDLPIVPQPFRLAVKKDEPKRNTFPGRKVKVIRDLLAECTTVVGYGDPDAEGQLLQDELLLFLGNKKPVLRLWSNALDDASMAKALGSMKPNSEYIGWYEAALSRSQADWLYGINMTRACTLHARAAGADLLVSIGRVQTPTLALVVNRELEIRNFKPVDFHVPFITLASNPGFKATWQPIKDAEGANDDPRVDSEGRLLSKPQADAIAADARAAAQARVVHANTKPGTLAAPLPFSQSALQTHCSRLFGFTAKQTLDISQSLYLKKLTSYPRVDCEHLPDSQHADAPRILGSLSKAPLPTAFGAALLGVKPALKGKAWNDSKVTAHHAIVPVHLDKPADVAQLDAGELKVYLEIVKRYILQFWPVAKFNATEVLLQCGSDDAREHYTARGRRYTDEGWRKAFAIASDGDDQDAEDSAGAQLPSLAKEQMIALSGSGVDSKRTQAPKRFTDGTLISAMKNIYQYVKDPEYRKRLQAKEGGGIGTEATRASIIDTMARRGFVTLKNKELVPSEEAIRIIGLLPESMKAPDMTAMWSLLNDDVMARKSTHEAFVAKMVPWVTKMVAASAHFFTAAQFLASSGSGRSRIAETAFTCFGEIGKPGCGAALKHIPGVAGKYRSFFGCSDPACKKAFSDVDGRPIERADRPAQDSPDANKYPCSCKNGFLRRTRRKDNSFFWGCSNWRAGCKEGFEDLEGQPDLQGKMPRRARALVDTTHKCPTCEPGFLKRIERKDKSGYFWGCSAWREGCKAMFSDLEGQPDLQGKGKATGWRNGAPVSLKPRSSGHGSGYRGGRAVTPQMGTPSPK